MAVRPVLTSCAPHRGSLRTLANLTAIQPITLTRSFAPESLEYQQTLEIENTWPEKLMYALMVPHKAWAAGDELTTLVKFAPLAKGVRVISITSNLCETTRTLAKGGHLEKTRIVVSRKHDVVRGRAVSVDDFKLHQLLQNTLAASSSAGRIGPSMGTRNGPQSGSASPFYVVEYCIVSCIWRPQHLLEMAEYHCRDNLLPPRLRLRLRPHHRKI